MSAQMKHTLAALLAATALAVPSTVEAKGDKSHGGGGGGHEQNDGGGGDFRGGGEFRGGGGKHAEQRQARQYQIEAEAPRQVFEMRGNGNGKHARQERDATHQVFALPASAEDPGGKRWKGERRAERNGRSGFEAVPQRVRVAGPYAFGNRSDWGFKAERKFERQVAKQQRAAYRAGIKQERRWAREQRRALDRAVRAAPIVAYRQAYAGYPRTVRFEDGPDYRAPEVQQYWNYPAYPATYAYAPRYLSTGGYDSGWSYAQGYPASPAYSTYPAYSSYDAGYTDYGLGGLFGGSGGLGNVLGALLPLVLGGDLGLGGFSGDLLGTGLLGGAADAGFGGYAPYETGGYPPQSWGYQDASLGQNPLGNGQSPFGGDGLGSLLGVALVSGLLGGGSGALGGLGGLLGLGGSLGVGGLGLSDPNYAYSDPYASDTGLLSAFGL